MKKITIIIMTLLFVSSIVAQRPMNKRPGKPMHRGVIGMTNAKAMPQQQERMEMMMVWKLTKELELTPDQAEKFFPRMKAHRENMGKIDTELKGIVQGFQDKTKNDKKISDQDFDSFFNNVSELEKAKVAERSRFIDEMHGILDNNQRFKLANFKQKFAKDMREDIRKRQKMRAK